MRRMPGEFMTDDESTKPPTPQKPLHLPFLEQQAQRTRDLARFHAHLKSGAWPFCLRRREILSEAKPAKG